MLTMSRNVCRYFAQGTCRFGANCRFLHLDERGSTGQYGGFQSSNRYGALEGNAGGGFGGRNYQQDGGQGQQNFSDRQILEVVQKELQEWERGRQWVFSCFAPAKHGPCVPGLDDISPDEMRAAAYVCKGDAQREQEFASAYRAAQDEIQQWWRRVTSGDQAVCQVLVSLAKGESPTWASPAVGSGMNQLKSVLQRLTAPGLTNQAPSVASSLALQPSGGTSPSIFGGGQQTSVFGGGSTAAQSVSPFGKPAFNAASSISAGTVVGVFGKTTNSPFGSATSSTSPFGSSASAASASQFGSPRATSPFGGTSAFGSSALPTQQSFGGALATQSVFGGSGGNPFGSSQQSVFGQNQAQPGVPTQSVFGGGTTGPFGAVTQATASPFGSTAPFGATALAVRSPFGAAPPQATPSPFGAPLQAAVSSPFGTNTAAGGTSVFSKPAGGTTSVFGGQSQSSSVKPFGMFGGGDAARVAPAGDENCFSIMDSLSPDDMNEFKAEAFSLAKIPSVPPPREMC